MHNLTKTLLTSLALTLGACDAGDLSDDFGEGATEFRPVFGGFSLNTSYIGGHEYDEIDLTGAFYKNAKLVKVCLSGTEACIVPGAGGKGTVPGELRVEKSQLFGTRGFEQYSGEDFNKSRWYLELDHNRDGVVDSTIQLVLNEAAQSKTIAPSPVEFWSYYWAYDSKTATGLISKYIEQEEQPTPMCEVDPDTGSLGSVLLEDTSIDTSAATKGIVKYVPNAMFVACKSGAAGKLPGGWGYAMHDVGQKAYTNLIRAVRADYGNDGKSWTAPGQELAVTDSIVVNKQYDSSLKLEGLLSFSKGWLCVYEPRLVSFADVVAAYPNITICDEKAMVGDVVNGVVSDMMTQPVP